MIKRLARDAACATVSSLATIGILQLLGHLPLFFGHEVRGWNREFWDEPACALLDELELEGSGYFLYTPRESGRNFLQTGPHPNTTSSRRVRRAVYYNPFLKKIRGVVHFGADCEGPPQCVHGGCIAAVIDAITGLCAICTCLSPCVTANLTVNYRDKTPLGSQLGVECVLLQDEAEEVGLLSGVFHRKLKIHCKLFCLTDPTRVFAEGTALFVNAMLPSKSSGEIIPPFFSFLRPSSRL